MEGIDMNARRRRQATFFAVVGASLGAALLAMRATSLWPFWLVGVLAVVGSSWTGLRLYRTPCPACHQEFFRTSARKNPFASRCMHCGASG